MGLVATNLAGARVHMWGDGKKETTRMGDDDLESVEGAVQSNTPRRQTLTGDSNQDSHYTGGRDMDE